MILKTLKRRFLKSSVERTQKERLPIHEGRSFKTVGIVVNSLETNSLEGFETLADSLQILEKDLKIIYHTEAVKNRTDLGQNSFTSKDFSWNGTLSNPSLSEFLDREYDVLIGYSSQKNMFMDFVVARAKATLKVGLDGGNTNLYDLIFKIKSSEYPLFEKELVKYLQIINAVDK